MTRAALITRSRSRSKLDPFPRSIEPMLALLSDLPPDPANYNFEYKWDGVRAITYLDGRSMKIESRNQLDITRRYPELHDLQSALGKRTAVLDGEIVATDKTG